MFTNFDVPTYAFSLQSFAKMCNILLLIRFESLRCLENKEEKMPENQARLGRIEEEYKKELSQIIGYELKNPNVTGLISVTKVKVSNDLKYAKVYVSILNSKNIKDTITGLKKSAGFIRSELARRVNLRNTPELIFELDDSLEYGAKIDTILKEIMPKKED